MRLLFISQLFDPEYSIKGIQFLDELSERGIDVDVITTFPNYPRGKVFEGYKIRPWAIEYHNNIRIIRVWSYISHSKSKVARALSYLSFFFTSIIASLLVRKPSIIYAYHPQVMTGVLGIFSSFFRRVPFITDVQDLWPDALHAAGLNEKGLLSKVISRLTSLIYSRADKIIVLSEGFKKQIQRYGISASKIVVIYNWNAIEKKKDQSQCCGVAQDLSDRDVVFSYIGNIGTAQNIKVLIDAFANCSDLPMQFRIVGSGVEEVKLRAYVNDIDCQNVSFTGYISSDLIDIEYKNSDVVVAHLKKDDLFSITIPSKTQSYLYAGKPILMAVNGEAGEIVEKAGAGLRAESDDIVSIESAIRTMYSRQDDWAQMGQNGIRYYLENMSRRSGVDQIYKVLQEIETK